VNTLAVAIALYVGMLAACADVVVTVAATSPTSATWVILSSFMTVLSLSRVLDGRGYDQIHHARASEPSIRGLPTDLLLPRE